MTFYNHSSFHNPLKWVKIDGVWQTINIVPNFEKDDYDISRERSEWCHWKVIWISYLIELKNRKVKSDKMTLKNRNLKSLTDLSPSNDGYVKAIVPILELMRTSG